MLGSWGNTQNHSSELLNVILKLFYLFNALIPIPLFVATVVSKLTKKKYFFATHVHFYFYYSYFKRYAYSTHPVLKLHAK